MLGMLVKHEIKYIWKKMLLLALVLMSATVIGCLAIRSFGSLNGSSSAWTTVMFMLGVMGYYGILVVVVYGYLVITAVRFYKNVYGDEGYITNTLPVTARQIHLSKVLVYSVGQLIISILSIISVLAVGYSLALEISEAAEISFDEVFTMLNTPYAAALLVIIAIMIIISSFSNVTGVFGAVALGQYWKKHKIVGAVVSYVIIAFVTSVLSSVFVTIPIIANSLQAGEGAFDTASQSAKMMLQTFCSSTAVCLIVGVICYIITDYGLNRKLNLE